MKNWHALAIASDLNIPEPDLGRVIAPIEALNAAFRPLARAIPHEIEPAVVFRPWEDNE